MLFKRQNTVDSGDPLTLQQHSSSCDTSINKGRIHCSHEVSIPVV